jgi:hypothetical protein
MIWMRSTVDCASSSCPSPALNIMPRPQWNGMRPKRISPTGMEYSPQARFTRMLSFDEFCPADGGASVSS